MNARSLDLAVSEGTSYDETERNKPGLQFRCHDCRWDRTKATTACQDHNLDHIDSMCCCPAKGIHIRPDHRLSRATQNGLGIIPSHPYCHNHVLAHALRLDKDDARRAPPLLENRSGRMAVPFSSGSNRCDETHPVVPTREPARCTFKCARVGLSGAHVRTCPARVGILRLPVVRACQSDSVGMDRLWSQRKAGTWRIE